MVRRKKIKYEKDKKAVDEGNDLLLCTFIDEKLIQKKESKFF